MDLHDEYDELEEKACPLEHVGYFPERVIWKSGDLERAFAFAWIKRHELFPNTLDSLLGATDWNRLQDEFQPTTQRDARVAATIIQWLGTNVGFHFMLGVLEQAGYRVAERNEENGPR